MIAIVGGAVLLYLEAATFFRTVVTPVVLTCAWFGPGRYGGKVVSGCEAVCANVFQEDYWW